MNAETRVALNRYLDQQAALNNADADSVRREKAFTIVPSVQQKLIDKQQEDSSFLAAINIMPVEDLSGEKLGLSVTSPLASRTDTTAGERQTTDPSGLDADGYVLKQTNSDTHITYAKLDQWAKFPDFQARISNQVANRQALDRIMIGFNGTSAAVATDRVANPLLQDVNIGWLQQIRAYQSGLRHFHEGAAEAGKIIIDPAGNGDYRNIHSLVKDTLHNFLPSWARNDPALVAVLADDLEHDTFFPLVDQNLQPTETLATDLILSARRVGGKRAVGVPYFPDGSILITRLDNLSIYEQAGKRRRTVRDNAARSRIETFESSNDGYVIEDRDFSCLIENIQFGPT